MPEPADVDAAVRLQARFLSVLVDGGREPSVVRADVGPVVLLLHAASRDRDDRNPAYVLFLFQFGRYGGRMAGYARVAIGRPLTISILALAASLLRRRAARYPAGQPVAPSYAAYLMPFDPSS